MKRVVALAAALALLAAFAAFFSLELPYAGFGREVFVDIPKGSSTFRIARQLAGAGVVRYSWQFVAARALRRDATLQAGEYRFANPASPREVLDRVVSGDVYYHELAVPEGYSIFDIAGALASIEVMRPEDFLEAAQNPEMIRDLAPEAPSLEGYLFPSTYRITRHTTAARLCRQMTDQFRRVWRSLDTPAGVHRTVTLASLVEKETSVDDDRALVASVFENRLRLKMPLQCDPTAIYAALLEQRYRGTIYRSDLTSAHPYNTYRHAGLPPGPIASPGLKSLQAALNPAQSDYLYFVARPDGSGAHVFSRKLDAHQRAVIRYRRGAQKNEQTRSPDRGN